MQVFLHFWVLPSRFQKIWIIWRPWIFWKQTSFSAKQACFSIFFATGPNFRRLHQDHNIIFRNYLRVISRQNMKLLNTLFFDIRLLFVEETSRVVQKKWIFGIFHGINIKLRTTKQEIPVLSGNTCYFSGGKKTKISHLLKTIFRDIKYIPKSHFQCRFVKEPKSSSWIQYNLFRQLSQKFSLKCPNSRIFFQVNLESIGKNVLTLQGNLDFVKETICLFWCLWKANIEQLRYTELQMYLKET